MSCEHGDTCPDEALEKRVAALVENPAHERPRRPWVSEEARRKREPLPVEELAGALHDRGHVDRGGLVASRPLRCQRCGGPLTTDGRCRSVAPPMGGDE